MSSPTAPLYVLPLSYRQKEAAIPPALQYDALPVKTAITPEFREDIEGNQPLGKRLNPSPDSGYNLEIQALR